MPNLRGTRQRPSRTSSPFTRTANASPAPTGEAKKEPTQSRLDTWIEPPLRSPVPSFQDHGLERTALFQDMAPLGAMPPMRLKLKIKGDFKADKSDSQPVSDVATATPDGTPPAETKMPGQATQEQGQEKQEPIKREEPMMREETAGDATPNGLVTMTPQIRSPAVPNGTPTPAHSRKSSTAQISQPSPQRAAHMTARIARDPKLDKVVRKAIEMAKSSGQEKLAAVITMFYEETYTNPALAVLFDAVITKRETDAQKKQFATEMKRIRKAVKKDLRESSRARAASNSAPTPPTGYSGQPLTITTMSSPTIGQMPTSMTFFSPHANTRPGFSPQQSQQPPSPFTTFRNILQPSPFSPTQSLPGSPTFPPNASSLQARVNVAPASPTQHSGTASAPQQAGPAPPAQSHQRASAIQQQSTTSTMNTRRSTRAAGSDAAALASDNAQASTPTTAQGSSTDQSFQSMNENNATQDSTTVTNGSKQTAAEVPLNLGIKSIKLTTKSPKSGKSRRHRRSPSVESASSLSSVDEAVVEKGNPVAGTALAATQAESMQPSRAVSRSATPRPGAGFKAKIKKGSNLKNLAGTKRGASETLGLEEADEETQQRREKARANFDRELRERKAEQPPELDFTSFRESEEYLSAAPDAVEARSRRSARRQSAPDTSKATSTRSSTAVATPAPVLETASGRRARQSTQNQRLPIIDVVASAPRLEVHTPSTPSHPPSDAESNGDPPPKRRKTARTKYSPVKLPNGIAPKRFKSPSRGSPSLDGGREGKKANRDQCYACGCGGDLICCDMCQNSFHAECWDPPCQDASDEPFQGFEWICTHCRIFDRRKENEERAKKGEPLLFDISDDDSDLEMDDDEITTPPDWTLVDALPIKVPLFEQLTKGFKELLPEQFGLKPMIRDAYDGYIVDSERRYRPVQKAPINVESRLRPTEAIFDDGKHIKDPKEMKQCVHCGLSAVSKKGDLIKCDTCGDFWHLDCLPNPTAAPPQTWSAVEKRGNRMTDVFKKRYWECPRHVDQDMILLTDPNHYAGNPINERGIKVRLPKKQVSQVASVKTNVTQPQASQTKVVRDAPDDVMHVNIEVDDSWWERYDTRKNELKETDNNSFTLHENNVLADFAAKARTNRFVLSQTNDELMDALVPNTYQREQLKKQWHNRQRAEIDAIVQKEVEATMTLAGLRQNAQGINLSDLLAAPSDAGAVDRLRAFMTQEQVKQMHALLDAVGKKICDQPQQGLAPRNADLDDEMAPIIAGGIAQQAPAAVVLDEGSDEPVAKRRKTDESAETT